MRIQMYSSCITMSVKSIPPTLTMCRAHPVRLNVGIYVLSGFFFKLSEYAMVHKMRRERAYIGDEAVENFDVIRCESLILISSFRFLGKTISHAHFSKSRQKLRKTHIWYHSLRFKLTNHLIHLLLWVLKILGLYQIVTFFVSLLCLTTLTITI